MTERGWPLPLTNGLRPNAVALRGFYARRRQKIGASYPPI